MKNSAILLAAFSIAACGDGDGADTECSPDCDGQVPNGGLCVTFNSLRFTCGTVTCNMANCTVDTTDCRIHCGGGGRIEFETCSGNDCLIGMYCREGVTTDVNVCLTSCDRDATTDTCGASRECVQWSQTPGDGVCLIATATRDTGCFENYTVCIDGAGACGAAGYDDSGDEILRCKIECDEAAVGTPGSIDSRSYRRRRWLQPD